MQSIAKAKVYEHITAKNVPNYRYFPAVDIFLIFIHSASGQ